MGIRIFVFLGGRPRPHLIGVIPGRVKINNNVTIKINFNFIISNVLSITVQLSNFLQFFRRP